MKRKKLDVVLNFYRGECEDLGSYSINGKVDLYSGIITLSKKRENESDTIESCVIKGSETKLYVKRMDHILYINKADLTNKNWSIL